MAVDNPAPLCRCGFPNHLPEIRSTRFYDGTSGQWLVIEQPQPHWPDHPCCHHWMVELDRPTCGACQASRQADRDRTARNESPNYHD